MQTPEKDPVDVSPMSIMIFFDLSLIVFTQEEIAEVSSSYQDLLICLIASAQAEKTIASQ